MDQAPIANTACAWQSVRVTDPVPPRPQLRIAEVAEVVDRLAWQDFTCPGCGRTVQVRATSNMGIEWESHENGRYVGFLMRPPGLLNDFAYEVAIDGIVTSSGGGQMAADIGGLPAEAREMLRLPPDAPTMVKELNIHDCASRGAGDSSSGRD